MNPRPLGPISRVATPRLQLSVLRFAESFVCRRCVTNSTVSHESFDAPFHFHPEIELLLMERSHGTRYVGDSVEPYSPGDLVLIGANVPHVFVRDPRAASAGEPAASIVVQFRPDFMGESFFAKPELHAIQQMLSAAVHGLHYGRTTVRVIGPRLRRLLTLQGAPRLAALIELLAELARAPARPLASSAFHQHVRPEDAVRLARVLDFARGHLHQPLSQSAVARVAGLSPSSFSRWFSKATGKSFVQFLTDVRLAHAYRMLTETDKPVTEIAYDSGFNSVSHFIHRFRRNRGMSPRVFRQRVAEGREAPP